MTNGELSDNALRAAHHAFEWDVAEERERQIAKWGDQRHEDGTGDKWSYRAEELKAVNDSRERRSIDNSWGAILLEEVYEALAETDRDKLREELIQVAAVCAAWVSDIDRRPV